MNLWTYRRAFHWGGQQYLVCIETGFKRMRTRLLLGTQELARDETELMGEKLDYRNHLLHHVRPSGESLEVEAGWVSWWSAGIAVRVNGQPVHHSHPGRTICWPAWAHHGAPSEQHQQRLREQQERDRAQWVRNKPSIMVDVALGLLFFAVSKLTGNLTTAALVGAGAGLAVVVAQRFVKADLLGGLALFGVFTLLLSAGFSLWFQDERMVQLKGTLLGILIALIVLTDALLNRGRYFGQRMARYIPGVPVNPQRLAGGIAALGLTMASLNLLATEMLSKDAWLIYTTFIDAPLGIGLSLLVFHFARAKPDAS